MPDRPRIVITMGDPAGVGPEIILNTIADPEVRRQASIVVAGYPGPFRRELARVARSHPDRELPVMRILDDIADLPDTTSVSDVHPVSDSKSISDGVVLHLLVPDDAAPPLDYGHVDPACGLAAARSIEIAARLAIDGDVDAIVTAPINKESLNAAGYNFPGHTEFLRHLTGAPDIAMMLTLGDFRVVHVTTHVAMREVPDRVTAARVKRVATLMHEALGMIGIGSPRIAVAGLNPHAGEGGLFGDEELNEIGPAVQTLAGQGVNIVGPLPPDTVFARAYSGEFDGVVAMYHDQGHIGLKLAGFTFGDCGREVGGVNTTLGLPIIRTSVDHGTAFDIAGRDEASPRSMVDAIELAVAFSHGKSRRKAD
jgi:4-phospho-D-threonate 3-dehydrogenase / 4-phospho-D-erythronate 3-dehydrogenase